ncbi:MAG: hypothetical protein N3A58_08860 [Spirochaetes bacterium]|nr:hypothetical protein [Spirochaetota bacterium]
MKLCLIFGGVSPEHEVSIASAYYCYNTIKKYFKNIELSLIYISKNNLIYSKRCPYEIFNYFEKENKTIIDKFSLEKILDQKDVENEKEDISFLAKKIIDYDLIFPMIHGPYGEDGNLQGFISILKKKLIGFDTLNSAIGMDKVIFKNICIANNIKVAPFIWYPVYNFILTSELENFMILSKKIDPIEYYQKKLFINIKDNFLNKEIIKEVFEKSKKLYSLPFFLKASNLGSSIGVYKIDSYEKFWTSLKELIFLTDKIIIEKQIEGFEIEVSYLKLKDFTDFISLPGRVIPSEEFYSYEDKYLKNEAKFEIPVKLEDKIIDNFRAISLNIIKALNAKGFARIDFFYDNKNNEIYCNEINSIPGFTRISMYPQLLLKSGLSEKDIFENLIFSSLY